MSKLKNIKPSKLFVIVAITVFVAGGINIVLGNYMTAAWCAFVAILELVIASLCKDCEYWQQRADEMLELGSKIQDENENLLANLRTAKEVLMATIIDRDNANAEIAKLKQEVEQLEKEKTESIFLAVDKGSNSPKIFTSEPKRHNEMFSGNGYLGRIILEKNVYNPDLSNLTFDNSPIEIKILHKILF